ncbi:MAG: efflux RND transporter periplasmic adaptor subunit [Phycisphaerales bacterium]|nr:efflux RND transporter periplasmic adaptor subunit [Phycisphaerales bacterium]
MRLLLSIVVLAGLLGGGYYAWQNWNKPAGVSYRSIELKRGTITATVTATGNLEPLVKVLVGSQVSGTVIKWYADFNQEVNEGFVLAQLDQDRPKAILQQRDADVAVASARVEQARADYEKAQIDFNQIKRLIDESVASTLEMDIARTALMAAEAAVHAAEAQVLSAQAARQQAATDLDKTIIRAPIDGIVISRDVDEGQTVAASLSAPTLFTIANDLRKMRVSAAVGETDIGRVREGMPVEFRVDAYPRNRFKGLVAQVRYAETIVDNVVTYKTLIDVDNPELLLRPGMTATILFEVAKAEDVLVAPNAALRFDPKQDPTQIDWSRPGRGRSATPRVFKLVNGQPEEIKVELGLTDGSQTEIRTSELNPGDKLITELIGGNGGANSGRPMQQRIPRGM